MSWVAIALLGAGLLWTAICAARFLHARKQASTARAWPVASGTIISADVEADFSMTDRGDIVTSYFPRVAYSYTVAGVRFEGTRFQLEPVGTTNGNKAKRWVAPYVAGGEAEIRYNPADPSDCILDLQASGANHLWSSAPGLALIVWGAIEAVRSA
jgi:hypothetical protein